MPPLSSSAKSDPPEAYLDWAATTPPDPDILAEALDLSLRAWGNPSSAHRIGKAARACLDEARGALAGALRVKPETLVFTASGTEADQIPLLAALRAHLTRQGSASRILVSGIEHQAVYAQAQVLAQCGMPLDVVAPRADGRVHAPDVAAALRKETVLVAVMAVNNETGAVQDLSAISQAVSVRAAEEGRRSPLLFADCVQALGKVPIDLGCVDAASFSAHKLRGPKGAGALYLARALDPLGSGGGQERGIRSGTESLQAAWGMALAARHAASSLPRARDRALALEKALIEGLRAIPGVRLVPDTRDPGDSGYSPFIVSASFPGLSGEVLARALADRGICVSTGAACSQARQSGKHRRILAAMGLPEGLSMSAIRISTGPATADSEIVRFLEEAAALYRTLKT